MFLGTYNESALLSLVACCISACGMILGTYIGSPWGQIRGKVFDHVGGVWKGINWLRVRVEPVQRGTLDLYRKLKDGLIEPELFSYAQMNIRRAVLQVLGHIARMNLSVWIYPIWERLVTKRGWTMTGTNAFVKRNAATLLNTMDRDLEFLPATNAPDLAEMLVSDGDLEGPAEILTATYNTATGDLIVTWTPDTFTNGAEDDVCHLIVAKKPILESVGRDGTWYPELYLYPLMATPPPPGVAAERTDGTVTAALPTGLDAADLTVFLFFRDDADVIGFSPSLGFQATTPV